MSGYNYEWVMNEGRGERAAWKAELIGAAVPEPVGFLYRYRPHFYNRNHVEARDGYNHAFADSLSQLLQRRAWGGVGDADVEVYSEHLKRWTVVRTREALTALTRHCIKFNCGATSRRKSGEAHREESCQHESCPRGIHHQL